MAYFANSTEGACFEEQCSRCRLGWDEDETVTGKNCPIETAQILYNYDAVNNEVATAILKLLVKDDGTCTMFELCRNHFEVQKEKLF